MTGRILILIILVLLALVFTPPIAQSEPSDQDLDEALGGFEEDEGANDGLDEALGGFEDTSEESCSDQAPKPSQPATPYSLTGDFILSSSYNYSHTAPDPGQTDYRELSRLKLKTNLELDILLSHDWRAKVTGSAFHDFAYTINGRDKYTNKMLDTYENEAELREAYINGKLSKKLDIKIGRQTVVWGKSDNIRITDVINPLDNRESAMVDIEDLRLPLAMSRLDYYFGAWGLMVAAIHEIDFGKTPATGSDFNPTTQTLPTESEPDSNLDNTEYAVALNGIFSGFDLSFYFADVYNDVPNANLKITNRAPTVMLEHARLTMFGAAANIAWGSWLIKLEMGMFDNLQYFSTTSEKSRLDSLVGVEYLGINDVALSLEVANRHLYDFEEAMKSAPDTAMEDEYQTAIRGQWKLMRETLTLSAVASLFGKEFEGGAFFRLSAEYDINDLVSTAVGLVDYRSGSYRMLRDIGENDRLFWDLKYSF